MSDRAARTKPMWIVDDGANVFGPFYSEDRAIAFAKEVDGWQDVLLDPASVTKTEE